MNPNKKNDIFNNQNNTLLDSIHCIAVNTGFLKWSCSETNSTGRKLCGKSSLCNCCVRYPQQTIALLCLHESCLVSVLTKCLYVSRLLAKRIHSSSGLWACPLELLRWHEQQGYRGRLEDQIVVTSALVLRLPIEPTGNCFCNFRVHQEEVLVRISITMIAYDPLNHGSNVIASCMTDGCRDTIRNILLSVYGNKDAVDEELVEVNTTPL